MQGSRSVAQRLIFSVTKPAYRHYWQTERTGRTRAQSPTARKASGEACTLCAADKLASSINFYFDVSISEFFDVFREIVGN